MSAQESTTTPCRLCAFTRAAWLVLRAALMPRTFAAIAALAVLALMAPSSIPPSTIKAIPKTPAAAKAPAAAAPAGAPPAAAATPAAASAAQATAPAAGHAPTTGAAEQAPASTVRSAGARPADPAGSSAAGAASAPLAAVLRFRDVTTLPSARVGARWGPHEMLEGPPPYVMSFVGKPPDWIDEFAAGTLRGTPRVAKTYDFTLQASSKGGAGAPVTQAFRIHVLAPAAAARARLTTLKPEDFRAEPSIEIDQPFTYRLDKADLDELTAVVPSDPDADPPNPKPPELPTAKQLEDMLKPLLEIDYPTEAHFRKVLGLAHCEYYRLQLRAAAKARGKEVDDSCPKKMPPKAAEAAASAPMSLPDFYRALMPPELADRVAKHARKPHPPEEPPFDAGWTATPGCGCVPPMREEEVYGFVSYWGSTEQQKASPPAPRTAPASAAAAPAAPASAARAPAPREVDFSLFSRLSFFGAMLDDQGDFHPPPAVSNQGHQLARDAQRHGTGVDLVVHRNEWDSLLSRKDMKRIAARAAENAVKLLDARQMHGEAWHRLLLPFWREETHAFGGITVFFDDVPADDSPLAANYKDFRKVFLEGLIGHLEESRRSYRLNIVAPEHRMDHKGLYAFDDMTRLIERAEPVRTSKKVEAKDKQGVYKGKSDITVFYLVLLSDPTTHTKKDLRARIDQSEEVKGARRVTLLESLVPVLLRPPAKQPLWGKLAPATQFNDDLAYMKWNFGGVALWELPAKAAGDKERLAMLKAKYQVDARRFPGLCDWVCPRRLALRLALQALLVVGAAAIPLWFFNCTVRGWGGRYKAFLWGGGLFTVPLALALNECDPALQQLRESNGLLIGLVILLFVGGLYMSFKSRRAKP